MYTVLQQGEWSDTISMRFMWAPRNMPKECPCGAPFSLAHSQVCSLGGFRDMRHNNVGAEVVSPMKIVHNDVETEPVLQPVPEILRKTLKKKYATTNTEDGARADIRVNGFWKENQQAFFDIRVFYPHACSYAKMSLDQMYKSHRAQKKREYCSRINEVEHGSFSPLICSSNGSVDDQTEIVLKRLASKVAEKTGQRYSECMRLLRCRISFSLLRSALRMLRGSRSRRGGPNWRRPVDVMLLEARVE